jgi:hypothetical protein
MRISSVLVLLSLLAACTPTAVQPTNPGASASPTQPSTQPSGSSASPTAQPSEQPGTQPGSQPSTQPGTQPGTQPSSAPNATGAALAATSLRLSAPTRFLSRSGESVALQAELIDANGQVIAAGTPLNWTSSRPSDFSVDANGLVKAIETNGYSEITATLPGTSVRSSIIINVSGGKSSGGSGSAAATVRPPVVSSITASSTNVVGAGVPIQLSATAEDGSTFSWRCTGNACSDFITNNAGTVLWRTPATAGVYTLELAVTRNGQATVQTIPITVTTGSANVTVNTGLALPPA